jgi:hypothetical protein
MSDTITHKVLRDHLVEGKLEAGEEIAVAVDQLLSHFRPEHLKGRLAGNPATG